MLYPWFSFSSCQASSASAAAGFTTRRPEVEVLRHRHLGVPELVGDRPRRLTGDVEDRGAGVSFVRWPPVDRTCIR
jgi:hypothetical protein